ncbi:MAG: response regulator [Candidatus Omnitrophica bacterium]|nr:response regulator [Candidatus Omnitrophota bacterium]
MRWGPGSRKIMVIDDDPSFLNMVRGFFQSKGYEVFSAEKLEDAGDLYRREKPRVILLDFKFPRTTGEKIMPVLQSADSRVQVIVISGCLREEVEEKFKGLGYFAFFEKGGLSLERVKEKVDEALSLY